jgi:hypothetical protein
MVQEMPECNHVAALRRFSIVDLKGFVDHCYEARCNVTYQISMMFHEYVLIHEHW